MNNSTTNTGPDLSTREKTDMEPDDNPYAVSSTDFEEGSPERIELEKLGRLPHNHALREHGHVES